ncbi:leucine-rich repeat domain-containing protein, partial [Flammeovirga sp. SJP92]|uniref:leucine-rich repeat domain-containing protein n=1 Tax=Flammeovirga sp. SJP92 TaxID=1775430 RepID=UPI0015601532
MKLIAYILCFYLVSNNSIDLSQSFKENPIYIDYSKNHNSYRNRSNIQIITQNNGTNQIDSLALVEFVNQNPENTLTWDLNQPVSTWSGITIKNNRVTEINLPDKNLTLIPSDIENLTNIKSIKLQFNNIHTIPEQLTSLESLQVLNLNGNKITRIIDGFSNMTELNQIFIRDNNISYISPDFINANILSTLRIENNNLSFSDLENINTTSLQQSSSVYSPQNNISQDSTIYFDNNFTLYAPDSATNNQYQWHDENGIMTGETNRTISISQDGTYHCIITNVDFPDLAQVQTGTYTMFNAGPFLTDSTAVAKIYTLNNNNSLNWNLNSPISTWNGISHSGNPLDRITDINIQNKNISTLPNDINVLDALNSLQIDNNYLTFEELEKITQAFPSSFIYAPQNKVGETLIYSHTGNNITLNLPAEINSPNNSYQWYKDNIIIVTGGNSSTYTTNEMGSFYCLITNSEFPDLTLKSNDQLILNAQQFVTDSSAVADIYTKNINNTLTWDINQPITSWEGITFANGRINQVKVNNAGLDTIPSTFANLDQLDTLFVHNNSLTFESLENIFTTLPQNFIYTPQSKIGSEQYLDVSGGVSTTLNLPDDFDTNTANNTFQWYNNGQAINNA